uniref:Acrosin-binding protein n=1 Tax=Pavo cristatus TaxID=9049 RepID=A0A8C9LD64_PAVCR
PSMPQPPFLPSHSIVLDPAQQLGTPLSNDEYRQFFRSLRTAQRASTACHLRALYGCQNPVVRRLDEYENHGAIPEGKGNHNCHGKADG